MDFVQCYCLGSILLGTTIAFWRGVFHPNEVAHLSNLTKLGLWPISVLLSLPVIGRIFGWW